MASDYPCDKEPLAFVCQFNCMQFEVAVVEELVSVSNQFAGNPNFGGFEEVAAESSAPSMSEISSGFHICDQSELQATDQWQTLLSTNYPDNHGNSESCGVVIHSDGIVHLKVQYLNLEDPYDHVDVYDGSNAQATMLHMFTGSRYIQNEIHS